MINLCNKPWYELTDADVEELLLKKTLEESFFFEFKDDRVSPEKVIEEISAFANTFGGYIFLGINDSGEIEGCSKWDEQRVHTTIYDSITPLPAFDVRRFLCDKRSIYIIKIEEGAEPPYITNKGKVFERVSSGTCLIKDSHRLSQLLRKRESELSRLESALSIDPISNLVNNVSGYIDIGFVVVTSDKRDVIDLFSRTNICDIAKSFRETLPSSNIMHVGNSMVFTPGGLYTDKGFIPAHTNNFIEITADGSVRMRAILNSNDDNGVNMIYADSFFRTYREVYERIMGDLFPEKFIYARKYESLAVVNQFNPSFYYDKDILNAHPEWEQAGIDLINVSRKRQDLLGIDTVVTSDRIPKTGLYLVDKRKMEEWGIEYTSDYILDVLFESQYVRIGYPEEI